MITKNIIYIANLLLTRRCNLRCSYCGLVQDLEDKPDEYPDIKYYHNNEISSREWINIIKRIRKNNPKCFFILYGGEPFLYEQLYEIINYCNIEDLDYTIISNNTDVAYNRLQKLFKDKKIEYIKGYTASVDPVIFDKEKSNDIRKKSENGLKRLIEIKQRYPRCDVVAEITVTKENIKFLNKTVQLLTKNNIYASITCIDQKKNKFYDFSSVKETDLLIEQKSNHKKIFSTLVKNAKNKKLLIHCPDLIMELYKKLPCNLYCNMDENIHNITIDSDGKIRTCLRIRGLKTPELNIENAILENGIISDNFKFAMKEDLKVCCENCNWTCILMSQLFNYDIVH